jgi:inner membrane protein
MIDYLGWAATAVFVGSYFFKRPESLRRVQMLGALMWVAYGLLMKAAPVVVANVLVLAAALWTARRPRTAALPVTSRMPRSSAATALPPAA